jgi:hydroxypyruvate isomerase
MRLGRREFIGGAAMAAATAAKLAGAAAEPRRFSLNYAPHFGMFRHSAGDDLIDQLQFMADQGFTAMEDNGMGGRSHEVQERIAQRMQRLHMTMGVFVAHADFRAVTFASADPAVRKRLLDEIQAAVTVAALVNARWCTVVPGCVDRRLAPEYQAANVIENLKRCAEICEPAGLVMVLEPLNTLRDHPGLFLTRIPQAYMICEAVNSPSCAILDDLYHQQITEGNLIPNIDAAWGRIEYFQVGDNPGRNEPGTGEINYRNIFRHLLNKGYEGLIGMEHGNSLPDRRGEQAVIDSYVRCDV